MSSNGFNFMPDPKAPAGPLSAIVGSRILADSAVRVYFGKVGENFDDMITGEGFTAYERAQFIKAFEQIEAVANVTFEVVNNPNSADFRLVLDTNELGDTYLGYFFPPGTSYVSGVGVFNGDYFDRFGGGNLELGGLGASTVLHELLHGLGVMHPHDTGGDTTIMAGVTAGFGSYGLGGLNQGIFTTMSYNYGYQTGRGTAPISDQYGHQSGPMALDIAALQLMYGAAENAGGNTTYQLPDQNVSGTGWHAIWDTSGVDRIVHDGFRDATIDLRPASLTYATGGGGFVSAAEGVQGGFTIAAGVIVERALGGYGDDRIIGNGFANVLSGRDGDDVLFGLNGRDSLYGGNGSDVLRGGAGNDRLLGQADNDRLLGNSGSDYLRGGAGDDLLFGLNGRDSLYGGNGSDVLRGGSGNDRLFGQAGNDRLLGNSGSDYLRGGVGSDTFIFRQITDSSPMISQRDVIGDFARGVDKISFAPIDGHTGRAGNQAFEFIGRAGFDGDDRQGDVRIHHLTQGGVMVAVDQDGDGHRDFIIEVQGVATLSANDFIL